MRSSVKRSVKSAFYSVAQECGLEDARPGQFDVSIPKEEKFGDFATNIAMLKAPAFRMKPRELADRLVARIKETPLFESVEVAGPGFINMRIKPVEWTLALDQVFTKGAAFGHVEAGGGEKVIVEFVSANPTGPLHIGHGRGAALGDTIARVLRAAGYQVHTEYYINDVGLQMDNLGRSTLIRARELCGLEPGGEPPYKGEYMIDVARGFLECKGRAALDLPEEKALALAREYAGHAILGGIRTDLDDFRVHFDQWFSEDSLHKAGGVEDAIAVLSAQGEIYEKDGALWLKTLDTGDEKDRVVRRANGVTTYLAADIAYHKNKLDRGYHTMVNIWGADHHGYIPRIKATLKALGGDPDKLAVRLVQIVNLKRGGQVVAMSTRSGVFTTLREILDDVGVDATRYFFLMRSSDAQMDFDVDLAKKQSDENPVYYIQYAHARCSNIFVTARERGLAAPPPMAAVDLTLLTEPEELRLIRKLLELPDVVESCARAFQPHPLTQYLTDTAALFHYFYHRHRVVTDNKALSNARLTLVEATRITLHNGLFLLGINAPDKM
ncbi:MAG: arginine--tRNA ligase [Nitrospinae bacterium]|nr:arginine--tRNA ligase [Nitrospinota bacterium]